MVLLDLDPNVVKPGWTPLLITLALAVVIVLLFRSMRKQIRRIQVPRQQPPAGQQESVAPEQDRPRPADAGSPTPTRTPGPGAPS